MLEGFFTRQFLKVLDPMQKGHLRLRLPDGTERHYGTPGAVPDATCDIRDRRFFTDCALEGDIGFGDAFVRGYWDTDDLTALIKWFLANYENSPVISGGRRRLVALNLFRRLNRLRHRLRRNTPENSRRNIQDHYDLSNEFFELLLDPTMTYSSARYESDDQPLPEAQAAKYDALCRMLRLHAGDHVLEIGCGWGGFAEHAARHYGCRVTGVTISQKQFEFAVKRMADAGLAEQVEIRLQDYRKISGTFTKIASIEMIEAVGDEFLEAFFAKCEEVLAPEGLLGIQAILCPDPRHDQLRNNVDWIQRRIFPGSLLPSMARITEATRRTTELSLHALEDMGLSYARTLAEWRTTFNQRREDVLGLGFDSTFLRKWNYYLSYCQAAFAMRSISVSQMVFTRPNNPSLADVNA